MWDKVPSPQTSRIRTHLADPYAFERYGREAPRVPL